jgi:hypothetical protein
MKFRVPEIVLGAFLTVAVFAMGMLFASSPSLQTQGYIQHATTEQHAQDKKAENHEPIQSLWVPTDSVGLYTLVLAIFTGLLAVVAGVQGFFMLRADKTARIAANAARDSADVANKTLIETQRPWVSIIEMGLGPLIYDDQGARITITAQMKNVGSVPAININLNAAVYLIGKRLDVIEAQQTVCEEVKRWKAAAGPALFPSDTISASINIPISKSDIEEYSIEIPGVGRTITPVIVGCADYVIPIDGSHRQTRFALILSEKKNGEAYAIYPANGDIPADRLMLTRWIGGGFSAD